MKLVKAKKQLVSSGMTIVEVLISLVVIGFLTSGLFVILNQSRVDPSNLPEMQNRRASVLKHECELYREIKGHHVGGNAAKPLTTKRANEILCQVNEATVEFPNGMIDLKSFSETDKFPKNCGETSPGVFDGL